MRFLSHVGRERRERWHKHTHTLTHTVIHRARRAWVCSFSWWLLCVCVCASLPSQPLRPVMEAHWAHATNPPRPWWWEEGETQQPSLSSLSLAYATVSTEHSQFHKRCVIRTFCQLIFKYSFWFHSFFSSFIHSLVWFLAIKKKKKIWRENNNFETITNNDATLAKWGGDAMGK